MISVQLTRGKTALISDHDRDLASMRWNADRKIRGDFYAKRTSAFREGRCIVEFLHQVVAGRMGLSGPLIDHADRNTLNCQRGNLRSATYSQNTANHRLFSTNTSGVTGVHWDGRDMRWRASIRVNGKLRALGNFLSLEDAARVATAARVEAFGSFAVTGAR